MVTDEQVRLLRRKMEEGHKQEAAAAAAGMSERSARRWAKGSLPSQAKAPRSWRTRPDPLARVWESEVVPMLVADTQRALQATTVLDELRRRCPQSYDQAVLRTLQRRIADWRAAHGPEKEVYFEQVHHPGCEGAFDFTDCGELGISMRGAHFAHLWFEMVLTHSGVRSVSLAFSETFEALLEGLQHAVLEFEGVPAQFRSDNLSAATHQLKEGGRELNRRFASVLEHYGARLRRIEPGKSHQNGVFEKAHDVLKNAIRQALILRKSKDFDSVDDIRTSAPSAEFVVGLQPSASSADRHDDVVVADRPIARAKQDADSRVLAGAACDHCRLPIGRDDQIVIVNAHRYGIPNVRSQVQWRTRGCRIVERRFFYECCPSNDRRSNVQTRVRATTKCALVHVVETELEKRSARLSSPIARQTSWAIKGSGSTVGCWTGFMDAAKESDVAGVELVTVHLMLPSAVRNEFGCEKARSIDVANLEASIVERTHVAAAGRPVSKSRH